MSDIEHQLIIDIARLEARVRELEELVLRAIRAAREAQDAHGVHDPWLDEVEADISATDGTR